jgi:hypothetical protein
MKCPWKLTPRLPGLKARACSACLPQAGVDPEPLAVNLFGLWKGGKN